jgi:outer membrane immunogenic protein
MRVLVLAALAATALAAAPALASEPGPYVNFGYTQLDAGQVSNGILGARGGYNFNRNFAVEGEAGIGVSDDEIAGVDVGTDFTLGGYALARAPLTENLSVHARAGYQHLWASASIPGFSADEDDGSFAVGVGGEVALTDRSGIRADWTRYTGDDGSDAFSVAYTLKF